ILFDACRADRFLDVIESCETRVSVGSDSFEYVQKTFSTGTLDDTVYVTANPHLTEDIFRECTGRSREDVFAGVDTLMDVDDAHKPEKVTERAIETVNKTGKRVIVHYMQPHDPFLEDPDIEYKDAVLGRVSDQEIRDAYDRNLERAWASFQDLLEHLDGRILVTADHGEYLGECGLYGHILHHDTKVAREVPLYRIEKDITEGIDI
ncbi:MAG: hypothetical protein SVU32_05990, partial [Candidatus Nanohaloarchaea archaeon]|nr:hypothetical protein [Candidatus Nanohaloarchaea archaeon]